MRLLIDTEVFIWSLMQPESLGGRATDAILDPVNSLIMSVVTPWEIAIKTNSGKLSFPVTLDELLALIRHQFEYDILPIEIGHALAMQGLPMVHRDPFDRMLVAQAKFENLTIVTNDRMIAAYDVQILW